MRTLKLILCAVTAVFVFGPGMAIGQSVWIAPGPGVWNAGSNWSTPNPPNGDGSVAIVGAPGPVTLDLDLEIASLTVEADGSIFIPSFRDFRFSGVAESTLTNLGSIEIEQGGILELQDMVSNGGQITAVGGNATGSNIEVDAFAQLDGGGTITLVTDFTSGRIFGGGSAPFENLLEVGAQTINGAGEIGFDRLEVILGPTAVIDANVLGGLLEVNVNPSMDPAGFGMTNNGIMRASLGGELEFFDSVVDNSNGVIEALAGSTVTLSSNTTNIVGGLIRSVGDGQVQVGGNVDLDGVAFDSDFVVGGNSRLRIAGPISNVGTITLNDAGAGFSVLEIAESGVTLTGGGSVVLTGAENEDDATIVAESGGPATLTVVDQTIEGQGRLGTVFSTGLAYIFGADTLVDANDPAGFPLEIRSNEILPDGFGVVNNGTMRASSGGDLEFSSSVVDNSNGVIEALAGSTVSLGGSDTNIVGGTIRTAGDGQVRVGPGGSDVFVEDLTLDADIQTGANTDFGISGVINNTGTITLNDGAGFSDIEVQEAGATLTGGGSVVLTGAATQTDAGIVGISSPLSSVLTVGDQTIEGRGRLGGTNLALILGADTLVNANDPGFTVEVQGNATISPDGFSVVNSGTMRASSGGDLEFFNSIVDNNNGVIEALAGSTILLGSNTNIAGGTIRTAGDGQVLMITTNVFLEDLTLDGDVRIGAFRDFGIRGTINNLGTITTETPSFSDIEIQPEGATITGNGTINLLDRGRINGFAPFTMQDGTLTGNGLVLVDSTLEGVTISPGVTIGEFEFDNSDSAFTDGTTIVHQIMSTVNDPGVTADVIDVSGQLDLDGVTIELATVDADGIPAMLSDFDPNADQDFVVAIANSIGIADGITVNTDGFANDFPGAFTAMVVAQGSREALIVRYSEVLLGDVNLDGVVNLLDVAPFVEALADGTFVPEADINQDGTVNLLDVGPFIQILGG